MCARVDFCGLLLPRSTADPPKPDCPRAPPAPRDFYVGLHRSVQVPRAQHGWPHARRGHPQGPVRGARMARATVMPGRQHGGDAAGHGLGSVVSLVDSFRATLFGETSSIAQAGPAGRPKPSTSKITKMRATLAPTTSRGVFRISPAPCHSHSSTPTLVLSTYLPHTVPSNHTIPTLVDSARALVTRS